MNGWGLTELSYTHAETINTEIKKFLKKEKKKEMRPRIKRNKAIPMY